jgi:hypothetical protein
VQQDVSKYARQITLNHGDADSGESTWSLREQAPAAIGQAMNGALALLRGVATGELDGANLDDREARGLVATATDAPTSEVHDDAIDRRRRKAKAAILTLLQAAELAAEDLDEIDEVVHRRLIELAEQRKLALQPLDSAASTVRRLGTGTIEAKMISNGHSAKLFGPYLYARFMEDGRYRSRYIGKASDSSTTR